ncbi:TPA: hypothetical protein ACH3X3_013215 [Trebouxia sp. C0006]
MRGMSSCLPSPHLHLQALRVHPLRSRGAPWLGLIRPSLAHMSTTVQGHNGHPSPVSTAPPAQASTSARPASVPEQTPVRAPLSLVVTDAVKRWYIDTNREAVKGDVKQQALLGQMLLEGYGCDVNQAAARMWVDKAKRRGYRMAGVYCEL